MASGSRLGWFMQWDLEIRLQLDTTCPSCSLIGLGCQTHVQVKAHLNFCSYPPSIWTITVFPITSDTIKGLTDPMAMMGHRNKITFENPGMRLSVTYFPPRLSRSFIYLFMHSFPSCTPNNLSSVFHSLPVSPSEKSLELGFRLAIRRFSQSSIWWIDSIQVSLRQIGGIWISFSVQWIWFCQFGHLFLILFG